MMKTNQRGTEHHIAISEDSSLGESTFHCHRNFYNEESIITKFLASDKHTKHKVSRDNRSLFDAETERFLLFVSNQQ